MQQKRSIGLSVFGYGLLVLCGIGFAQHLVMFIQSLFTDVSMYIKAGGFTDLQAFQRHVLALTVVYGTLIVGLIALVQLKDWGRRLLIITCSLLCIYTLYSVIILTKEITFLALGPVVIFLAAIGFLLMPRITRQYQSFPAGESKTVLLVDDDRGFLKMMRKNLGSKGFDVLTAATGEQGLEIARKRHPDLIVLDVILPGMKGRKVCAELKSNVATADIPVVFLTSKDSPDDIRAEIEAGAVTHLTKPADPEHVAREIKAVLGL